VSFTAALTADGYCWQLSARRPPLAAGLSWTADGCVVARRWADL